MLRSQPLPVDDAEAQLAEREAARSVLVARELAVRALEALRSTLTARGHYAQTVPHEGLGYCGHRTESPRCVERRALIGALSAVLEG